MKGRSDSGERTVNNNSTIEAIPQGRRVVTDISQSTYVPGRSDNVRMLNHKQNQSDLSECNLGRGFTFYGYVLRSHSLVGGSLNSIWGG